MNATPPKYAMKFLRWFCREDYIDEIEGNLVEIFEKQYAKFPGKARRHFILNVARHFRPSFMKSFRDDIPTTQINIGMLKNYFKTGWRNLQKNKAYSFINIFGLALGLSCTIFILLWVQNELSWDRFNKNINHTYRVYLNRPGDDGIFTQTVVPLALWDALKNTPGTKYVTPANSGGPAVLSYKDINIQKQYINGGEDFLKMFDFRLIEGSPQKQLNDASSIVLTQSTAKALFGNENALGKTITIDHQGDLTVSGVVKDPPPNSSIQFDCIIPFKALFKFYPDYKEDMDRWDNASWLMYVTLENKTDPNVYESAIKNLINTHTDKTDQNLILFPFKKVHLYSKFENGKNVGGDIIYVKIFTLIAILILSLAYINFINLSTARSAKRSREVGIRKTIGSSRIQLIYQFLSETLLVTLMAFALTAGIVILLKPLFNELVNKNLNINYHSPYVWMAVAGFILLTGIVSGGYPAFFLSAFNPIVVLKNRIIQGKRAGLPRKIMLTTQFFFSIGLIISTMVIMNQIHYVKEKDTGYDKDSLVMVPVTGDIEKNYDIIRNELMDKSLASSVTLSSSPVTALQSWSVPQWEGQQEKQKSYFGIVGVGYDYERTLKAKIIDGRGFDRRFNDSSSAILNQAAVDYMQWKDPIGKVIHLGKDYTVVGVVDNIVMNSPFDPVYRTIFLFRPKWAGEVVIRLKGGQGIRASLNGIESVFNSNNPGFPFSFSFVDEEFNKQFSNQELTEKLADIFSVLAIIISSLGLLGLAAYAAEQRTKEAGIRKVFGASVSQILFLFSSEFNRLVIVAFLMSAPFTWWIMNKWLKTFSIHISVAWWMLVAAGIFALMLTWIIVGIQALKTAFINPVESLKSE